MLHTFFMEDNEKIENNVQIENCISGDENSFNNLNVKKIFGDNVKYYRKKMGLSQEQLSEILEISPNHLSVIETGGKFVTSRLLEKMVFVFKIPPSLLFYSPLLQNPNVTSKQISQIIKEELENAQIWITSKIEKLFRG